VPDQFNIGLVKCRITYSQMVEKVEYEKYSAKEIRSLKLVDGKEISYHHKSVDRAHLHSLYEKRGAADDIIIVRNGLLTDTYYGNIALLKSGKWYTPSEPLLQGTMRSQLLAKGYIFKRKIKVEDISAYESITVFNAMINFKSITLSTEHISV